MFAVGTISLALSVPVSVPPDVDKPEEGKFVKLEPSPEKDVAVQVPVTVTPLELVYNLVVPCICCRIFPSLCHTVLVE